MKIRHLLLGSFTAILLLLLGVGCSGSKPKDNAQKGEDGAKSADAAKKGSDTSDKAYPIKIKLVPDANKSTVVRCTIQAITATKVTADGKSTEQKEQNSGEAVYTETVLEAGEKAPKKFKRAYEKAVETSRAVPQTKPYQGMTVVFTLEGKRY